MRRAGTGIAAVVTVLALVSVLALMLVLATGCRSDGQSEELVLTGTIVAHDIELQVPLLATLVPDVTVGVRSAESTPTSAPPPLGEGATPNAPAGTRGAANLTSATRTRVASVSVAPGDTVQTGDVVAVMDQRLHEASLRSATAAAEAASASVDAIDARLGKAVTTESDMASQTAALNATITELLTTRATLQSQLAAAQSGLATLETAEPTTPTTSSPDGTTQAEIAAEKAKLRASITELTAQIATLDEGIAEAQAGIAKIQAGQTAITDAERLLEDMRGLAVIGSEAAALGVEMAQARLQAATILAPEPGTVIQVAGVGDALAPGAPVVTLRRMLTPVAETWVDAEDADRVSVGQEANVLVDSRPFDLYLAHVTFVGSQTDFPPTSHATRVIHMIRAVKVRVTLDGLYELPAGTPADVTITTR